MESIADQAEIWIRNGAIAVTAMAVALASAWLLAAVIKRVASRTDSSLDDLLAVAIKRPALLVLPVMAIKMVMPSLTLPDQVRALTQHLTSLILIVGVWWLLLGLTMALEQYVQAKFRIDVQDNLSARRINTQVRVLRRAATIVVTILALAAVLMTFPTVRQLGASLLASAGLAGLVLGLAARPVLQNLLAGMQLALTQPIRLDDVVIVEGEWGRIEEILSTYVVVRIWDERRLIVPLNYFVENPFQNWTRTRADILGTAFMYVDYSVPVEEVRAELHRILKQSDHWDGKAWALQVTDLSERTVQLRALMSARDASSAFSLRCEVRERLVAYVRDQYPDALPRVRADVRDERLLGQEADTEPVSA